MILLHRQKTVIRIPNCECEAVEQAQASGYGLASLKAVLFPRDVA
jgi:hypothetical protein